MRRKAWLALGGFLLLWGALLIIGGLILAALGFAGGMPVTDPTSAFRTALGNALALMITFGLAALLYYPFWKSSLGQSVTALGGIPYLAWVWIMLLMLGLQPVLPWMALDEKSFTLPPAWKPLEERLEAAEAQIETMILSLLTHGALGWNILFLAAVPAVVEELFFRGALQGILSRLVKPTIAIWITAGVFSAVHGQVYGFIPRMLLGALMGYLVFYSQNLLPAMWAHFLNNAYATLLGYLAVHFLNAPELISSTYRPPVWVALLGAGVAGAAGYQVYRLVRRRG